MSYMHLTHTRARERTPDYEPHDSRPLVRRDTLKRDRTITLSDLDDDGYDDYPYPSNHPKFRGPSRALTIRDQPSQLERYNIWSSDKRDDDERRRSYETRHTYKYADRHYHTDEEDTDESAFRLKINSTFDRPSTSHHHHSHETHLWPSDAFRRRDKWVDEHWEARQRSTSRERSKVRRNGLWGDFEEKERETQDERWSRYHRTSETKTEELRPLSGWRRSRIIRGN
ncbi:hypothetical protein ACJQWK_10816 [Exserohilum turcicum]|uniref:Uncharacterized protein n=1 Tax=Exserohilum turcicum (strain 28A) TaxID=671987 RepID=R0I7Y9_EXST2|nr:uncharacterized protein SETTUDRAFT_165979 [Exserohilum turcica Et28A]EOA81551.1 hypothetical protein SETTUDRAFT_165979 [Exserohilum turcica Et28A]